MSDCRPLGLDPTPYPVQLFCEDNEYNAIAALWFQTPEATVKALFHDPPGSHKIISLVVFVVIYYVLSCVTYGLSVSLGIFIPTLLVGAAWGRLTAMGLATWFPHWTFIHPGKYALIGAAANLGKWMTKEKCLFKEPLEPKVFGTKPLTLQLCLHFLLQHFFSFIRWNSSDDIEFECYFN